MQKSKTKSSEIRYWDLGYSGRKRVGFTLIELLVSITLFLLAISVALSAMIGSNSLIARSEARSAVAEGARVTADTIRRSLVAASGSELTITGNSQLEIRKFFGGSSSGDVGAAQNVCVYIFRAKPGVDMVGLETFTYDETPAGTTIAMKVVKAIEGVTPKGNLDCSLSVDDVLYTGRLVNPKVEVTKFQVAMAPPYPPNPLSCSSSTGSCLLRYDLELQEAATKQSAQNESRKASIEVISSVPVGVTR